MPRVDYRSQMVIAYRHYLDKNYNLALATYRRVLADYPGDATALSGEAWSLYYLGDGNRAGSRFPRAVACERRRFVGAQGSRAVRRKRRRVMRTIIETLLVNERGIAFDPVSGETYQLLGPALPLVKLLQQGADNATLLQFLLEEYNVDAVTARRDLEAFLHSLEEMKLWAMQKSSHRDPHLLPFARRPCFVMNHKFLVLALGISIVFPVLVHGRTINLVQNPGFEIASGEPRVPDDYDLQGAAKWGRAGGEDEYTTQGILFPGDAKEGGSVSQMVHGIDQAKGRWLTFRFRGLAQDGFAVTDNALAMKIEFFSKNGTNFLDGVTRLIYREIETDRVEPDRQWRLPQGRRRRLAQLRARGTHALSRGRLR